MPLLKYKLVGLGECFLLLGVGFYFTTPWKCWELVLHVHLHLHVHKINFSFGRVLWTGNRRGFPTGPSRCAPSRLQHCATLVQLYWIIVLFFSADYPTLPMHFYIRVHIMILKPQDNDTSHHVMTSYGDAHCNAACLCQLQRSPLCMQILTLRRLPGYAVVIYKHWTIGHPLNHGCRHVLKENTVAMNSPWSTQRPGPKTYKTIQLFKRTFSPCCRDDSVDNYFLLLAHPSCNKSILKRIGVVRSWFGGGVGRSI